MFKGPFGATEAAVGRTSSFVTSVERSLPEAPPTPPPHALQVYLFGIEEPLLRSVMGPLGLSGQVRSKLAAYLTSLPAPSEGLSMLRSVALSVSCLACPCHMSGGRIPSRKPQSCK